MFRTAKTTNPAYLIDIVCPGHNFGIQVDMPEQLQIAVTSDWENRLPSSLSGLWSAASPFGGGVGEGLAKATGSDAHIQALSFQMWTGTSPIEIPLTVLFDAEKAGLSDVYQPITMLQSLIFPVNTSVVGVGTLQPPGPDVGLFSRSITLGYGNSGYGINVKLGRLMMFLNCIMVSANATFDSRMDNRGFPISGQLELVFRTAVMYGRDDWIRSVSTGDFSALA